MNLARLSKVIAFVANLCPCKKSENVSEPDSGGRAMLFTVHVYVCHAGSQVERPLVHLASLSLNSLSVSIGWFCIGGTL